MNRTLYARFNGFLASPVGPYFSAVLGKTKRQQFFESERIQAVWMSGKLGDVNQSYTSRNDTGLNVTQWPML